jgi:DNA-binding transcriptional ArsR family regulator
LSALRRAATRIDNFSFQWFTARMDAVQVIDDPQAATVALEPARSRLLAELAEPASAAMLAARLGTPRQKLTYHLRALEAHGLVREAETRRWGGITERLLVASAGSYLVSPSALGPAAADPARTGDHLSASYLIALAGRVVREVGTMLRLAKAAGKPLATLSIDTEIRFRSAAERAAFTRELTEAVAALAARYHDASTPGGRPHRLLVMAHPLPASPQPHGQENEEDLA